MKKSIFILGAALVISACGPTQTVDTKKTEEAVTTTSAKLDPSPYASTITSGELKEKLYVYASDEFEGRETGTPGQKKAVEFLKKHYVELGIPSPLGEDDYFQEVPLEKSKAPTMSFNINGTDLESGTHFVSVGSSSSGGFEAGEILNLGYGIDDPNYSNYEGVDVRDKVILIRSGEPKNDDGTYTITGSNEVSKWSNMRQQFRAKRDAAKDRGAKAILLYYPEAYDRLASRFNSSSGRISLKGGGDDFFFLMVNDAVVQAIYRDDGATVNTDVMNERIKCESVFTLKNNSEPLASENVIAYIKGSEKPNEYLVISAHLDHEGIKDGKIYNGADDDGSGTVSVMEIAEAFKAAADNGEGPKRSVVFLHVTGEEKGLLGSRYYTDMDPVFPIEQTVANLNIDMIGRSDPKREGDRNYVYVIGSDRLSTELHELSEEVNARYTKITLDMTYNAPNDPNNFYGRSDHYNFAKNNVPVIFYFNGTHDDYHRPSDTVDKIEFDLLENRTKLIFHTAWEIVNRDKRISLDNPKESGTN
ncbi:MAG: M28 family peptidase [Flavobacteriaceae bacterium]|nr:M28 family peptidase [Flavobacteriaceae bacterium]